MNRIFPVPCSIALLAVFVLTFAGAARGKQQQPHKWGDWQQWGDQGDGTYINPVLPSDYSDIDCIRVGSIYYAISSTFQFTPGVIILQSRDLVNWSILGHAVGDLDIPIVDNRLGYHSNDPLDRYGKGIWAGAIRYHDNKFWIYFSCPDTGYFMCTATNPAGPWTRPVMVGAASEDLSSPNAGPGAGWDDCCPFWDDDGQGYLVGTNFSGGYKIHLWKLTPDGQEVIPSTDHVIHQSKGSEANKLYKFNGYYYHLFSEVKREGRVVMMERSRDIFGPYTEIKQLSHADRDAKDPNQGGLVEAGNGHWYWYTHHGSGDWEGRADSLLPVTWVDGWPIIGVIGPDGIGSMVWSGAKPLEGTPVIAPQSSDEFNGPNLGPQWEWNYQPVPPFSDHILTERPGWLRLRALEPLKPDNLMKAFNTLTQRCFRTSTNEVIMKIDVSGMADGQKAGLCHFAQTDSTIGVSQDGGVRHIESSVNGVFSAGPVVDGATLWLKSTWGLDGKSQYAYSLDGSAYTNIGDIYQLTWGHYRGDRSGIFTFNDKSASGYLDVDYFHYNYGKPTQSPGNTQNSPSATNALMPVGNRQAIEQKPEP